VKDIEKTAGRPVLTYSVEKLLSDRLILGNRRNSRGESPEIAFAGEIAKISNSPSRSFRLAAAVRSFSTESTPLQSFTEGPLTLIFRISAVLLTMSLLALPGCSS